MSFLPFWCIRGFRDRSILAVQRKRLPARVPPPRLEALEDRTLPAVCSWIGGSHDSFGNPTSGDPNAWSNSLNWLGGVVPGAADEAVLSGQVQETWTDQNGQMHSNTGPFTTLSVVDSAFAGKVGTLIIDDTYGQNLRLDEALSVAGDFEMASGNLQGTGQLNISNSFDWSGGILEGTGNTVIAAGAVLTIHGPATKNLVASTIANYGTTLWTDSSTWGISFSGDFINEPHAVFEALGDGLIGSNDISPFGFLNAGTFMQNPTTGTTEIDAPFDDQAGGTVAVESGTLDLAGGGQDSGAFQISSGATLAFGSQAQHHFDAHSSVTGAGTVSFINQSFASFLGKYNVGTTLILGGEADFNAVAYSADVSLGVMPFAIGNLSGTGQLVVSKAFDWSGGYMQSSNSNVTPSTVIDKGAVLTIHGTDAKNLWTRNLDNYGTTMWTDSSTWSIGYSGDFVNEPHAVFDAEGDGLIGSNEFSPYGFLNSGTFVKSPSTGTTEVDAPFDDEAGGIVQVKTGTLDLAGGGQDSGAFQVSSGATLAFGSQAQHHFDAHSSVTGAGTVSFINQSFASFLGKYNVSTTQILSGEADFDAPATSTYVSLENGGTLGGTGKLAVSKSFDWSGGYINGSGNKVTATTVIDAGAVLTIHGSDPKNLWAHDLDNYGTTLWTDSSTWGIGYQAVFTNEAGAIFNAQGDGEIGTNEGGMFGFVNAGTFEKTGGTASTTIDVPFENLSSGTIALPLRDTGVADLVFSSPLKLAGKLRLTGPIPAASKQNGASVTLFTYPSLTGHFQTFASATIAGKPGVVLSLDYLPTELDVDTVAKHH